MENTGQKVVDEREMRYVFVLWKGIVPVFLAIFLDETTDVKESGAAFIFAISLGSLPQEPDNQPSGCTCKDHPGDDKSDDIKSGGGRTAPGSREDVNGLGCH